jgi:hypothetical protein
MPAPCTTLGHLTIFLDFFGNPVMILTSRSRRRRAGRLDSPLQLADSLAAAELELPAPAVARLDEVSAFDLGFPQDFIKASREFVYGPAVARFVPRTP